MAPSSRILTSLTCLVSIALVATPALISIPFQNVAHAQTNSTEWSDRFNQAQKLEDEDKYAEAEALYRQLLSQSRPASRNDSRYYYLQIRFGQILQAQGKFTEAIEVLQRVINNTTNIPESQDQARRTLTRVLESQQNAAELVASGLQELRNEPNTRRGYFELARGLAVQGQLANGFTFLETNLGRPLTPESALELARAANSQGIEGDMDGFGYRSRNSVQQDAIALYRQLVNRYPDQQTIRAEFIELLRRAGRQAEVVALYQEEVQTNPPQSRPTWELARALVGNGQIQEAIAVYDQLVAQGEREPRLHVEFGNLLVSNQQLDRAIQVYLKGIQLFPRNRPNYPLCHAFTQTSYDGLIQLLVRQNRLDQILTILEQALPNPAAEVYANLALGLAHQYQRQGNYLAYPNRPPVEIPTHPYYREQAEAVNQRLKERYSEAESWEGEVETWRGGCRGDYE